MDTFAALMLATEVPDSNFKILRLTRQFNKDVDTLMTYKMYFLMLSSTIYQQVILFCIFYNGSIWFDNSYMTENHDTVNWRTEGLYKIEPLHFLDDILGLKKAKPIPIPT